MLKQILDQFCGRMYLENDLELMFKYPSNVNWWHVSSQEWALPLLMKHPDRVNWFRVSKYKWALPLLLKHTDKVSFYRLPHKEWAIDILLSSPKQVWWNYLPHEEWALPLMKKMPHKVQWEKIYDKGWAIDLMLDNESLIKAIHTREYYNIHSPLGKYAAMHTPFGVIVTDSHLSTYSFRTCMPWSISYVMKYPDRTDWSCMHENGPRVLPLLLRYPTRVDWHRLQLDIFYGNHVQSYAWTAPLFQCYPDRFNWELFYLSNYSGERSFEWLITFLDRHADIIQWDRLKSAEWCYPLLVKHFCKVDWRFVVKNMVAFKSAFKQNKHFAPLIDSDVFSVSPYPRYVYPKMKKTRGWILEELCAYLFHPNRINAWILNGNDVIDYLN